MAQLAFVLVLVTGCYAKHYPAGGGPFPAAAASPELLGIAGVVENEDSAGAGSSSPSTSSVVEKLVGRLQDDRVFSGIVFPYTKIARVEPSLVLDVTVRMEEKLYWGENMTKAVLVGLSLFLLQPVLPGHFGFAVALSVEARRTNGEILAAFASTSEYEFEYTKLVPSEDDVDEWLEKTADHAVEEVVNQIKEDHALLR